jgi:plastocyanin
MWKGSVYVETGLAPSQTAAQLCFTYVSHRHGFRRAPNSTLTRRRKMRTRNWILCVAASIMLALSVLPAVENPIAAGPPTADAKAEVKIDNFSFAPSTLTVKAGTQITWTNSDDIPHTVVSDDRTFKSKVLDTDEKFTFTAAKPGTYSYFCSIHPKMTGKVVVE